MIAYTDSWFAATTCHVQVYPIQPHSSSVSGFHIFTPYPSLSIFNSTALVRLYIQHSPWDVETVVDLNHMRKPAIQPSDAARDLCAPTPPSFMRLRLFR